MKKNNSGSSHPAETSMVPTIAGVVPTARRLAAGGWLFRKGDATFGIFFVVAGRLRMQRVTPDGETVIMHVARPGEMLAEASLFVAHYQCDVVAETDCEVWLYPKQELSQSLRDDPDSLWAFAAGLLKDMAAELGLTQEALYRALAMLEKKGAIKRTKQQLQITISPSRIQ